MNISLARLNKNPRKVMDTLTLGQAVKLVAALDNAFFSDEDDLVSDSVYDAIRSYINEKWPKSKLAKKIGAKTDDDVKLPVPMASLNQYQLGSTQIDKALADGEDKIISDKLDGLSIEIVYEGGVPVAAYTRGDATKGKDVSHHIPAMRIPQKIPQKGQMVIRSEALINEKTFMAKMHTTAGGRFKAARNAASGLVRNFETKSEFKHVRFVCFGIIGGYYADKKQSLQLKLLTKYGFDVVRHFGPFSDLDQDQLVALLEKRIGKSVYELDGIVVTNDVPTPKATASNPKHAFKFKMNSDADAVVVKVKDIIYQETKYGLLQPVAIFEPTQMAGGVTVQRANGHNGYYVQHGYLKPKKNKEPPHGLRPLGPGAVVKLIRSGKVIPYIMEILKPAKKPKLPDVPYTLKGVEFVAKNKTSVSDSRMLASFFSKLEIDNMGSSSCNLLIASGIKTPEAVFATSATILRDVLGDSRGRKLAKDIQTYKKGTDLNKWLKAVSPYFMRGADTTFDKIVDQIPNLMQVVKRDATADLTMLIASIEGVKTKAPDLASACINGYRLAQTIGIKLRAPEKVIVTSARMRGFNVAFTGIRDKELAQTIIRLGGTSSDSMKSDTTILIAKDPGSGSAKMQKAMDKGIPIYTPDEFRRKYKLE